MISTHASCSATATAMCMLALRRSLPNSPGAAGRSALLMQRSPNSRKLQPVLPYVAYCSERQAQWM